MSWLSWIPGIFKGTKEVAEVFVENKEKKGERLHLEKMQDAQQNLAVLGQFSTEFHDRQNRTKWDSFVDGLNRLPRPILTFGILGFFVMAPIYPERFMLVAKAYEVIPTGFWALLSVIIGFYFGGRMQLKQADFQVKASHVQAAKELVAMRKEFREFDQGNEKETEQHFSSAIKQGAQMATNAVVQKWLESKK